MKILYKAIAFSDVILLALPWQVVEATIVNAGDLSNKIIIDATNPLTRDFSALEIGFVTSGQNKLQLGQKEQKYLKPSIRLVGKTWLIQCIRVCQINVCDR